MTGDSFGRTRGVYEGEAGDPRNRAARSGCANYFPPLTCLSAPSSEAGRCDWCRNRRAASRNDTATERGAVEQAAEVLAKHAGDNFREPVMRLLHMSRAEALDAAGLLACCDSDADPAPTTGGHEYDRRARREAADESNIQEPPC